MPAAAIMKSLPAPSDRIYNSPKRKRADSTTSDAIYPPFAPQIDTTASSVAPPHTGEQSPRSAVASQMQDLSLQHPVSKLDLGKKTVVFETNIINVTSTSAAKAMPTKKRTKFTGQEGFKDVDKPATKQPVPELERHDSKLDLTTMAGRLADEITADGDTSSGPEDSISRSTLNNLMSSLASKSRTRRNKSPPPPSTTSTALPSVPSPPNIAGLSTPPSAAERSPSPSPSPPEMLFFQPSEITGHLVTPFTDPDDDGTGINGIGFRPTPAMAYARQQRRKQQISEWKARVAREERKERMERRLGKSRNGRFNEVSFQTGPEQDEKHTDMMTALVKKRVVRFVE